jgi:catechol 2,3-dioxygenase-like lactoylglutathione lyase family enzyme
MTTITPSIERLTHTGIFVNDIEKSRAFYKDMLGLTETDYDRGAGLLFLSADPSDEHHMVLLVGGRTAPKDAKLLQQMAFRCRSLDDVLAYWRRFVANKVEILYTITHGNAVSCYFKDPDDNILEVYWKTGLEARQGFLVGLDFDLSEAELMVKVKAAVEKYGETGYVDMEVLEKQM